MSRPDPLVADLTVELLLLRKPRRALSDDDVRRRPSLTDLSSYADIPLSARPGLFLETLPAAIDRLDPVDAVICSSSLFSAHHPRTLDKRYEDAAAELKSRGLADTPSGGVRNRERRALTALARFLVSREYVALVRAAAKALTRDEPRDEHESTPTSPFEYTFIDRTKIVDPARREPVRFEVTFGIRALTDNLRVVTLASVWGGQPTRPAITVRSVSGYSEPDKAFLGLREETHEAFFVTQRLLVYCFYVGRPLSYGQTVEIEYESRYPDPKGTEPALLAYTPPNRMDRVSLAARVAGHSAKLRKLRRVGLLFDEVGDPKKVLRDDSGAFAISEPDPAVGIMLELTWTWE